MRQEIAGHTVVWLEETTSTNEVARRLAASGELTAGGVVVADRQTAGRGRRGSRWVTLPGRSLAASILLAPPPLPRPSRLTVLGAVAACRALARMGVHDTAIKWPNDLMRGERKLGGILVEQAGDPPLCAPGPAPAPAPGPAPCPAPGTQPALYVLGIGINLQILPGDLPQALAEQCCDAGLPADRETRERLLAGLLHELDAALAELGGAGDGRRSDEYRARAWIVGRRVVLRSAGQRESGRVADVTGDGDLLLDGGRRLVGETVQLLSVERRAR